MEEPTYQPNLHGGPQGTVIGENNSINNHIINNHHYNPGITSLATSAWNIPFTRNPFFLGRDELLSQLRQQGYGRYMLKQPELAQSELLWGVEHKA